MASGQLCGHCGDTIQLGDATQEGDNTYHVNCLICEIPRCRQAVRAYLDYYSTDKVENIFYLGIHVRYLYGYTKPKYKEDKPEKRRKRELKLKELVRKVSALRNSNSGSLLIQLVGINPGDSFTGAFDEFADSTLNSLIEDGKLFGEVFHKERMNILDKFSVYSDFIVLRVAAATFLTTSDFKTKVPLDDCILNPSPYNVFKFLKERKKFPEEHPPYGEAQYAEDLKNLEENRSVQFKANFKDKVGTLTTDELIVKIVDALKLKEYISTFSKNIGGGVYLFGVGEEDKHYELQKYTSREMDIHGVELRDLNALKEGIEKRIEEEILVCDFSGEKIKAPDIIKVHFIPFREPKPASEKYVLKITVRHVHGIVFYDKDGPHAYKVDPSNAMQETRISVKEWFSIILKHVSKN